VMLVWPRLISRLFWCRVFVGCDHMPCVLLTAGMQGTSVYSCITCWPEMARSHFLLRLLHCSRAAAWHDLFVRDLQPEPSGAA
jgi:hypothetical protein